MSVVTFLSYGALIFSIYLTTIEQNHSTGYKMKKQRESEQVVAESGIEFWALYSLVCA